MTKETKNEDKFFKINLTVYIKKDITNYYIFNHR